MMRTGAAILLGLLLATGPALAQGKTKATPGGEALAALEVCQTFARSDALAVEAAIEAGWDAYEDEGESPFIRTFSASKELGAGIGWSDIFVLVEDYPDRTLGYCRLDALETTATNRAPAIEALAGADGFEGEVKTEDGGSYASLSDPETNSLLITHWDDAGFVIQLTILTPKADDEL
jgi:hypothetical protein